MSEVDILSTPRSKTVAAVDIPLTPNKNFKKSLSFQEVVSTPSKSFRNNITFTSSATTVPQTLPIDIDVKSNKLKNHDDYLGYRLNLDNSDLNSDFESISPLSEISSLPSSSPDIERLDSIDPFNYDCHFWNTKPMLHKDAVKLNKMIHSAMLDTKSVNENYCSVIGSPQLKKLKRYVSSRKRYLPRHKSIIPKKPILNLPKNSLNLIVSSSKGSTRDATIYATEINASASNDENKLPVISKVWERVTIPVNSSVKEKHKKIQRDLYGSDVDSLHSSDDEMENNDDTEDAALIRGFEFEKVGNGFPTINSNNFPISREPKKIRWVDNI